MKFSIVAVFAALFCLASAAEEQVRGKRQLLVASPYASYVASPYVASPYASYVSAPYVSAPYVAASPYNGGAYYKSGPVYAPAYAGAYYTSPYAYL